ncbi:flagellar motor protein MotB [Legionella cherrii]|uniref:Chemotaxis protein MotB n=1 Tax=Legionella cherrii TaxID=28084 RepID=A0ABY6T3K7_9GAMM|nr:flagellar motor protein MotB [Legionella cherrii]VEB33673.1 chemotaxis protein MotB [Legionella cherrii]
MSEKKETSEQIIRKVIKKHSGHHGGAWKIAYADFVTAMMAFFLLMWLVASLNKAQKEGISDYFKQPLKVSLFGGKSVGNREPTSKGGGKDIKDTNGQVSTTSQIATKTIIKKTPEPAEQEQKKLEQLKSQINLSIESDPALTGLKNQLLMEIENNGLRIQLIDDQKQPMFEVGSEKLNAAIEPIFVKLSKLLNQVPNKIIIEGYTDAHPYHNPDELEYTNWELSTQRANAARRALIKFGLNLDKVIQVSGYASTVLLNKKDPFDPQNRRISIVVVKNISDKDMHTIDKIKDTAAEFNQSSGSNPMPKNTQQMSP